LEFSGEAMPKLYHGTTRRRAEKILREGFQAKGGRNWFARSKGLARQYAQSRARQRHDDPVVLECDVSFEEIRDKEGVQNVSAGRGGVVIIEGCVDGEVISNRRMLGFICSADELAAWVNRYLGLRGSQGIAPSHPGLQRLRKWMAGRFGGGRKKPIPEEELVRYAVRWLPEYFSPTRLRPDQSARKKRRHR